MVADGELTLVDEMIASRVYADPFCPLTDNLLIEQQMGTAR